MTTAFKNQQAEEDFYRSKPSILKKENKLFPPNIPLDPYKITKNCPEGPYFVHKWTLKLRKPITDTEMLMISICRRCANMLETHLLFTKDEKGNVYTKRTVKIIDTQWEDQSETIHNVAYQKQTDGK